MKPCRMQWKIPKYGNLPMEGAVTSSRAEKEDCATAPWGAPDTPSMPRMRSCQMWRARTHLQ
eukprot:905703-Pelagomonas_calceolata.AAC.1